MLQVVKCSKINLDPETARLLIARLCLMRERSVRFVSPLVKELRKLFGHFYTRGDRWTAGYGNL